MLVILLKFLDGTITSLENRNAEFGLDMIWIGYEAMNTNIDMNIVRTFLSMGTQ